MKAMTRTSWVCQLCTTRYFRVGLEPNIAPARSFTSTALRLRAKQKQSSWFMRNRPEAKTIDFSALWKLVCGRLRVILQEPSDDLNTVAKVNPLYTAKFKLILKEAFAKASRGEQDRRRNPLFAALHSAIVSRNIQGLETELRYNLKLHLFQSSHQENLTQAHLALANFEHPEEWYPATRALQRTIHLHVGPTNSGKTYHALQALRKANTGVFAGPLRLLAHEVYTRFQAEGIPIALVTGEEQRFPDTDRYLVACTVEMAPLNQIIDVAVVDEIQMIADENRGWAWTAAVLGLMAKEVHLCGETRAVDIIRAICARTGDKLKIHRYERLNSLQTMSHSLSGKVKNLQKGDAVVSFSRIGLWALKQSIESKTGRRCAIVYGGLPPETRAQQAALFNDPDNEYDFLAASDAIGMGLNLSIKRVVFEAVTKNDGISFRTLTVPEIKQIGGRAGRFRSASQDSGSSDNCGYVTTLDEEDLQVVRSSFQQEPDLIKTAGLELPPSAIEQFARYFPSTVPLSFILMRLRDICSMSAQYHLCDLTESIQVADLIQEFPMSILDRLTLLSAPVNLRDQNSKLTIRSMARVISNLKGGHLLEIEGLDFEILEGNKGGLAHARYLGQLEALHRAIGLYLWLSYRFPNLFMSQALAFHAKERVEEKINHLLATTRFDDRARSRRRMLERTYAQQGELLTRHLLGAEGESTDGSPPSQPSHEIPGSWSEIGHEEPVTADKKEAEALLGLEESEDSCIKSAQQ